MNEMILKCKLLQVSILMTLCTMVNCSRTDAKTPPDGKLENGVRVITLSIGNQAKNLYVYRGEEVKLVLEKTDFPYTVHIPSIEVSGSANAGENMVVEFKAKETGDFNLVCSGKCPEDSGQQIAKIVVMEYGVDDASVVFKSIGIKEAKAIIDAEKPFLLDVRTQKEYDDGHIAGATLIPVQQLAERISEIESYKDGPVVVYCRSGNRSIPASQILIKAGFKKVYNIKKGILGWAREGMSVEQPK